MSSIQKMSIQGIRSFGPDDRDKQLLVFFTPLTLILGPNGTGKTTIIECLKYATTGDMPPNTGKGQSFIHDPKLANENEVRGQVKLQFQDMNSQDVVVTRSILLTQKLKLVQMKTLDGTITRKDKDGKNVSVTSKCADLNKEMVTCLGVSKPVLNYVIFCHQEDSNWPLSEGKALKQKFDDIFAATQYIKALDNINKIRKEQAIELKVYNEEIKHLRRNKQQAAEVKKKLEETETSLLVCNDTIKTIKGKISPLEKEIDFICRQENEIMRLNADLIKQRATLDEMKNTQQRLKSGITEIFQGPDEALLQAIRDFDKEQDEKTNSVKKLEQERSKCKRETERLGESRSNLLEQIGKLKAGETLQNQRISQREAIIKKLHRDYDIQCNVNIVTDKVADTCLTSLNNKLQVFEVEEKKTKNNSEAEEKRIQGEMDNLTRREAELEQSLRLNTDQLRKNKEEATTITAKLSKIATSAGRLTRLEKELEKAERDLKEVEGLVNVVDSRQEVNVLKKMRRDLELKDRNLDNEMARLNEQNQVITELEFHEKEKTTKEQSIKKIKNKSEDALKCLFGSVPSENYSRTVDTLKKKLNAEIKTLQGKHQKLHTQKVQSESRRKMLQDQLKTKEDELRSHEDKILEACGSENDFGVSLTGLEKSIKEIQDEKGVLIGSRYVYEKFVEKLEPPKSSKCCPLCHREFEDEQDIADLINDLNDKLNMIPSQLDKKAETISSQQLKLNSMFELKPIKSRVEELKSVEIPQLKRQITNLGNEIEQLAKEMEKLGESIELKESDEHMAGSIQNDMTTLDRDIMELKKVEKKIAEKENQLGSIDKTRTPKHVAAEKNALQKEVDEVREALERLEKKLTDHTDKLHKQKEKVNGLTQEKLDITGQLQEQKRLQDKKAELIKSDEDCNRIISQAKNDLSPLKQQYTKFKQERLAIIAAKDETLKQIQKKSNVLRNNVKDIEILHKEIQSYVNEGKSTQLQTTEQKLEETEKKIKSTQEQTAKIDGQISKTNKDLLTGKERRRELDDNRILRENEAKTKDIENKIGKLNQDMRGYNPSTLTREKRKMQDQIDQLYKELNRADGRQEELRNAKLKYKNELEGEICKDADNKYKNKLIDLKVVSTVCDDLSKYHKALDRAIMKYHTMKMSEINKIIRELWRNTYRGNDIDFVEIRSEDEGAKATTSRRTYNYRVVMIKGDTALDMRGRCSAGQKVLASIIIRLALAETFGLNCGVLALDEPTTNLDRENIDSLAEALIEIVKARQKQRNFQLLVITHDEDFLERLGHSEFVDKYYKVGKNHRSVSVIQKCSTNAVRV